MTGTFDKLCLYSGNSYCKKGYSVCMNLCRFKYYAKKEDMIGLTEKLDKTINLPDNQIKIVKKSKKRQKDI